MNIIFAILMGYLFGAIPSALLIGKLKDIDIRQHGSGNIGGTNTFRVMGKKPGIFVTLFDILKGVIPTLISLTLFGENGAIAAGIAASIGHSFSIFVKFKGGKSVATSTGVMLVLNPLSIMFGIIMFAIVLFTTKFVSLSSMLAASTVAISVVLFQQESIYVKFAGIFFAIFIIVRHHTNIKRLIAGNESKAFQKKK